MEKVEVSPEGCWLFTGAKAGGYGRIGAGGRGGKVRPAHRVAYELFVGPIPEGRELDHLCRVRNCVNPAHLDPVTRRTNLLRGETIPAAHSARTHCGRGHELSGDNLRIAKDGNRRCRRCETEWRHSFHARNPDYHREWRRKQQRHSVAGAE